MVALDPLRLLVVFVVGSLHRAVIQSLNLHLRFLSQSRNVFLAWQCWHKKTLAFGKGTTHPRLARSHQSDCSYFISQVNQDLALKSDQTPALKYLPNLRFKILIKLRLNFFTESQPQSERKIHFKFLTTAVKALVWNNGTLLCKIDFNRNLSF